MAVTREQFAAGLEIVLAVGNTVRELGSVPAGAVYAAIMSHGVSLEGFNSIVNTLVKAGAIRREGNLLVYAL
jgi:hypothetical protein